mmetsp:Transcript_15636/g.32605  ORF Transcript_15636/g.32605 Transcript_15636/m.32605 type:complete len:138 (-) Transcript_15636:89-502(-)
MSESEESESESESEDEDKIEAEDKRRAAAAEAAAAWTPKASTTPVVETSERKQGTPFQRVEDDKWMDKVGVLSEVDNSYEARFGEGGYGAKANSVLAKVRGKDFRHEKTKRKRGTYRGGTIDTSSGNSFRFADSDDE